MVFERHRVVFCYFIGGGKNYTNMRYRELSELTGGVRGGVAQTESILNCKFSASKTTIEED